MCTHTRAHTHMRTQAYTHAHTHTQHTACHHLLVIFSPSAARILLCAILFCDSFGQFLEGVLP
uniref:Uncharacterized protein n=1 Tax=Anguilla anguilla TaxID=7936 RepID=A0A0E9QG69_ANGAN